jgi:DNA modification methylase
MLETNKKAAIKFGIDTKYIEEEANTNKNIKLLGNDLTFINIKERDRTKHIHRLHPYLGKFIPQLVEVFLRKFFDNGNAVLDPFSGSGTTMVEANVLGINSIGIDISPFNILIQKAKLNKYNIKEIDSEIKSALNRTKTFSNDLSKKTETLFEKNKTNLDTDSDYLKEWFSKRALKEILFYRSIIKEYENKELLKVILSRATRSARMIPHYDLARPKKPIKETYWCHKHKRYCKPVKEALKFIKRYSFDTIRRIKDFNKIRTDAFINILQGDARNINLNIDKEIDGIFTSPPYVGIIDYHEQHKYAYELFDMKRFDSLEIGPASNGQSKKARDEYKTGIIEVFKNISKYLKNDAKIFIVANDKHKLYEEIGEKSGFKLQDIFHRPVLMRTERYKTRYFESIFYFKKQ